VLGERIKREALLCSRGAGRGKGVRLAGIGQLAIVIVKQGIKVEVCAFE
jgi:hypothetical protein